MKKLLASLAVSSVLLGACAKEPAPDPVNPRDAVLNAITAVYEAGTLHEDFKMSVAAAGENLSFSGEADVDNKQKRVHVTMDLGMLGGEMEILMDDGVMYMRSPVFQDAGTD